MGVALVSMDLTKHLAARADDSHATPDTQKLKLLRETCNYNLL